MSGGYDVLVTGGAGFIGSHLCEKLLEQGKSVCVIDDLSTGHLSNIEGFLGNDCFSFVEDTVLNQKAVDSCVEKSREVIHLAAAVGVENVIQKPVETIETNVSGTENVLRAARRTGSKVLIASTSEVYGKAGRCPSQRTVT